MARSSSLTNDMLSLWFQAPLVIAMRCQSMGFTALTGGAHDSAEMNRMVLEKAAATFESATAINTAMAKEGLALFRNLGPGRQSLLTGRSGEALAAAALRPYAKRVRSNNRRLNR